MRRLIVPIITIVIIVALVASSLLVLYKPVSTVTTTRTITVKTTVTTTVVPSASITVTVHSTTTVTSITTITLTAPTRTIKPIIITDFAGRTVKLESIPRRVIVVTTYWTEILCCLGVADRIVGIGKYTPYNGYVPDFVKKKTIVGSIFKGLNWEVVVSLNPDLLITDWYGGKYGEDKIIKRAEELGIPVIALAAKTVEDNIKAVYLLGKVFGEEDKAKELADWMEKHLENVKTIASKIPKDKKRNVLLISAPKSISGPITVYAKGSAWASIVELIGAHNLAFDVKFDTPWPKLDLEKIIAWWADKVDVLLVVSYSKSRLESAVKAIKSDPRWQSIKAVREGQVYGLLAGGKFGHFLDWGPRIIVGVYQIAQAVYPEYYPNWKKIANDLLSKFYGLSFYKTVTDFYGKQIKIPKAGIRAVVLNSYFELMIYTIGAYDSIVGVSKYRPKNPIIRALIEKDKLPEEMPNLGSLSQPNLEAIMKLNPDIIIAWVYSESYLEKARKIEETTGIPVVAVDLKTIDDFYKALKLFGEIFGKEDNSEKIINIVKGIVDDVIARAKKIPEEEKVTVFLVWSVKDNLICTEGKPGINTQILEMIGAIPVTANMTQKYPKISLEQLYKLDPDVLILFYMDRVEPSPEMIYKDPAWQALKAVKEKRVYDLRGYSRIWGWEPAGIPLRFLAFAKCCYPEYYKDLNFEEIANNLYNQIYGIPYSDVLEQIK